MLIKRHCIHVDSFILPLLKFQSARNSFVNRFLSSCLVTTCSDLMFCDFYIVTQSDCLEKINDLLTYGKTCHTDRHIKTQTERHKITRHTDRHTKTQRDRHKITRHTDRHTKKQTDITIPCILTNIPRHNQTHNHRDSNAQLDWHNTKNTVRHTKHSPAHTQTHTETYPVADSRRILMTYFLLFSNVECCLIRMFPWFFVDNKMCSASSRLHSINHLSINRLHFKNHLSIK